ncbi:MAG TPA: DsbA family oxidoreductase [Alphaproteobacteria bacterium]|nr:DsbA family oxidoreductase [Alphaproteobacteria bacterium]
MKIDIISDAICPWCYIGKRRLEQALAQAPQPELEVGWRPFQLNPEMPAEGMDRKDYLRAKFGDSAGGRNYDRITEIGREVGIPFAFDRITRTPNTILAHRLIRYATREHHQDAMVETLFRGYFTEGEDIGNPAALARLAGVAGLDPATVETYLVSGEDDDTIRAEDAFARQIGINGVPCFIIDRQYAISGAQPAEAFVEVFDLARKGAAEGETEIV